MSFLNNKIYFPDPAFILYAFIAICLLVAVIGFSETKYTSERVYNLFTTNTAREEKLSAQRDSTIVEINSTKPQRKYEADIATFAIWGLFGAVLYWVCNSVYKGFIKPFVKDNEESHYVHANKDFLIKKRVLWVTSVFLTFFLLAITIYLFITVVLSFYTIVTYDTTLNAALLFVLGVMLTTAMIVVLRVGLEILARTY